MRIFELPATALVAVAAQADFAAEGAVDVDAVHGDADHANEVGDE